MTTYDKLKFFKIINYTSYQSILCRNKLHKNCAPLVFQTVSLGLLLYSVFIAFPKHMLFWTFSPIIGSEMTVYYCLPLTFPLVNNLSLNSGYNSQAVSNTYGMLKVVSHSILKA